MVLKQLTGWSLCLALALGCSAETKQEAKEALKATSEAASAAAQDAKVNAKKAGEVIKSGVQKTKEEFSDPPPNPSSDSPVDLDSVPESQESTP
jgi:uncharacterized protein YpuA (DUF1002 family)